MGAGQPGDLTRFDLSFPALGTRGNAIATSTLTPGNFGHLLPSELAQFVVPSHVRLPSMAEPARVNADHGGSHPHLVAEFVASIRKGRPARVNASRAAQWIAPGIYAHKSALADGQVMVVPDYGS